MRGSTTVTELGTQELGTQEREALAATVRDFLADTWPEAEVRRLMETDTGFEPAVWRRMAAELGLQGLAVPAELGGAGYGFAELQVVFTELGAALAGGPFLATVGLALPALLACGEAGRDHLAGIAAGETVATVAALDPPTVRAADGRLTGTARYVLDGASADLILVPAGEAGAGVAVFAVAGDAPGLTRTAMVTLDATRKLAVLEFADTPATVLAPAGDGERVLRRTRELAAVAVAADSVGGAGRCLAMAAGYARERVQFGRPIGSFQAVKQKLAGVLLEVEQARSAVYYAAREVAEDGADVELAAAMAYAYCADAFVHAAADCVQVHGGIGFTWEHPAHLYLKRAKSNQLLLGHPSRHRARVAELVGI